MAITRNRAPGWWYPWLFVGGLGIVVVVNAILTFFAVNSWTGLETKNPFAMGLAYNQTLADQRQQDALGWRAVITYGHDDGMLVANFSKDDGTPVNDLVVSATLYRPSQDGVDKTVDMLGNNDGTYSIKLQLPLSGLWEVRLIATQGNNTFRLRQRIQVP